MTDDQDEYMDRDIFGDYGCIPVETLLLNDADDIEDKMFDKGCGCKRKCFEKFPRTTVVDARLAAIEMNGYCTEHINHHHVFVTGNILFIITVLFC